MFVTALSTKFSSHNPLNEFLSLLHCSRAIKLKLLWRHLEEAHFYVNKLLGL